jgi:hypothetical protein
MNTIPASIDPLDVGMSNKTGMPHANRHTAQKNRKIELPIFPLLGFCSKRICPKLGSAATVMVLVLGVRLWL